MDGGWDILTGNYIRIYKSGDFNVGEIYMKKGRTRDRGTTYKTDGSEKQFNR